MAISDPRSAWFIGEGTLLVRCAEQFLAAGHTVRGIASADQAVRRWAENRSIPLADAGPDLGSALAREPFDYLFSVVNLTQLDESILQAPRLMAVNFHDGPLPRYAGLNAPVWALLAGERAYGVTWHEMTTEVDAGRILAQQFFEVPDDETVFGLNARCYEAGVQAFGALVADITAGAVHPREQDRSARTVFKRFDRPAREAIVDWRKPAHEITTLARALDFGPYVNPFAAPRVITRAGAALLAEISAIPGSSAVAPGTVVAVDDTGVTVATGSGLLRIGGLRRVTGEALPPRVWAAEAGLRPGDNLADDADAFVAAHAALLPMATRHETYWLERLIDLEPLALPTIAEPSTTPGTAERTRITVDVPAALVERLSAGGRVGGTSVLAGLLAFLARLGSRTSATFPVTTSDLADLGRRGSDLLADARPVAVDLSQPWDATAATVAADLAAASARGTFFTDVVARYPTRGALKAFARWHRYVRGILHDDPGTAYPPSHVALAVIVSRDGRSVVWDASADAARDDAIRMLSAQAIGFLRNLALHVDRPVARVPLVDEAARAQLLDAWNQTSVPVPDAPVHEVFARQAAAMPDRAALICRGRTVTYRELDAAVNRLARYLRGIGVGPEVPVGLCLDRSVEMVVAMLAVLRAGGAYVPLDPDYPQERLAFIASDVGLTTVIVDRERAQAFPTCRAIDLERDAEVINREDPADLGPTSSASNLAYIIYTSGSTGQPKGVMLEHRNVANFLVAMDAVVPHDPPGVWLAVTSISFDISVLELLWTLARGFTVVLSTGDVASAATGSAVSQSAQPIDFSLFYFSADERGDGRDKYRLLLEGARFADTHGFTAVWTPERHFHAFGGLYPNPAVTGAAVAAVTTRVGIRAGSCVLPLHHPLRVVEEWSVVDNLSNGRVGIAFASGWQPNDFILRPESYPNRKDVLFRDLGVVQALWRGEAVEFETPRGERQAVRTMPRPVQSSLPTWITAAGNPETFAAAAAAGAGVLTHLLGQSLEELASKVAAYRAAWRAAGHPGRGHVVLMLHTLVSDSDEFVRDAVRGPLMDYLRTSIDLVKPFAESFPTFAARQGQNLSQVFAELTPEDFDALVEHSFERYYQTSGLFGRPDTCLATIDRLKQLGVDEIACLIDFGVPVDVVLDNLTHLDTLRQRANGVAHADDYSIAALVARHGVTHLQCTPSMAKILLLDPPTRQSLSRLTAMFVGGEALPPALAADLLAALPEGELWNMYGPTETTVWSTAWRVTADAPVSIGRPIANTRIYILDDAGEPVPVGMPGHLFIGGDGVARGYWNRPDLSADRFRPDPFGPAGQRIYATGDLARYRADGLIDFLGRTDQQVKIRGHRIELGEIEVAVSTHPTVREAVVHAREDADGDKRLVAYVIPQPGHVIDASALRSFIAGLLPDYLVPAHIVSLDAFPLTPNNKVDRRALPAPDVESVRVTPAVAATGAVEEQVADIWQAVLRHPSIGAEDNFFDIGGDSLLAAEVLSLLRQRVSPGVSLTDLFRFPTIRSLAAHIGGGSSSSRVAASAERARLRQGALQQRRAARPQPTPPVGRS